MRVYKLSEFAELVGVSISTLQRWDRDGILVADRTITNRREYTDEHLKQININRLGRAAQEKNIDRNLVPVKMKRRVGRPGADLTDRVFGELKVLYRTDDFVYENGRHDVMWMCECSCHRLKVIRGSNLLSGGTVSCGCMRAGRRFTQSEQSAKRYVSKRVMSRTEEMVHKYYGYWYVDSVAYETCAGSDTKIRLNCICKCGTKRKVLRSSLLNGSSSSCGCYAKQVRSESDFAEDLSGKRFGLWKVESRGETHVYPGGGQVIMWNCICECGTRKTVSRMALKSGESQSCGCASGPGMRAELVTAKCLDALGLTYVQQKKFDGLVGVKGKQLSFDFEVMFYDKIFLIECQGEQHFRPVAFFGGESVYEVQKEHDHRKYEYCVAHDIRLLEIPYTIRAYDDIYNLIDSFLNTLRNT